MWYSDDPVADFNRYDSYLEKKLSNMPKCGSCGEHIQDDYLYDVDGNVYCEECFTSEFRRPVELYIEEG